MVEGDCAGDADLVGGDGAFGEVGELLDVLQLHEAERVVGAVAAGKPEAGEALVGDVLEELPYVGGGQAGHALGEHVVDEGHLDVDRFGDHGIDMVGQASSKRSGSSRRTVSITAKAKSMWLPSSRKTQLGTGGEPVEEAFGA